MLWRKSRTLTTSQVPACGGLPGMQSSMCGRLEDYTDNDKGQVVSGEVRGGPNSTDKQSDYGTEAQNLERSQGSHSLEGRDCLKRCEVGMVEEGVGGRAAAS